MTARLSPTAREGFALILDLVVDDEKDIDASIVPRADREPLKAALKWMHEGMKGSPAPEARAGFKALLSLLLEDEYEIHMGYFPRDANKQAIIAALKWVKELV